LVIVTAALPVFGSLHQPPIERRARIAQRLTGRRWITEGYGSVNVKQAAARLEVSVATMYSLVASGKLKHYRIGTGRGVVRIAEEHLAEFLKRAEPKAATAPDPLRPAPRLKHLRLS
jgi:excisionase family DNA binding protein